MLTCYITNTPLREVMNRIPIELFESVKAFKRNTGHDPDYENMLKYWHLHVAAQAVRENKIYKTHLPNGRLGGEQVFPSNASVIHIVRNPVNVLPSLSRHMGLSVNDAVDKLAVSGLKLRGKKDIFKDAPALPLGTWNQHTLSWLNFPGRRITIRYEDMVCDPASVLSKALIFLGSKPENKQIDFAVRETHIDNIKAAERELGFVESSPHAQNAFFGTTKRGKKLSVKHGYLIRDSASELFELFSYEV